MCPDHLAKTGPNPTDRRKKGSKHHLVTDANGIPLAVRLTGANRHDVTELLPLIEATFEIAGVKTCSTSPETITVWVAADSKTYPKNYFSGDPCYTTVYDPNTQLWKTTVTQGTFVRDTQGEFDWSDGLNEDSQFYDMIVAEEAWHKEDQIENSNHAIWGTAYLTANIMNAVQANEPYTDATEQDSLDKAQQAFQDAKDDEKDRSSLYLAQTEQKCALEEEAKDVAGSSHCLTLECTNPECQ